MPEPSHDPALAFGYRPSTIRKRTSHRMLGESGEFGIATPVIRTECWRDDSELPTTW
jgi:hypothetical protein